MSDVDELKTKAPVRDAWMRRRARSGSSGCPAVGTNIGKIRRHLHDRDGMPPGLAATPGSSGRGLSASHLVSGADDGGGAGERQAQGHDRVGGEDVEDAVHLDRHDLVPYSWFGAGFRSPCPMWTMLR